MKSLTTKINETVNMINEIAINEIAINEMAVPLKDYKQKVDGLRFCLVEN